jgi:plasmid stability protein
MAVLTVRALDDALIKELRIRPRATAARRRPSTG